MIYLEGVAQPGLSFFGSDGLLFQSLLATVAQLSVVLWSMVIITAGIRFVGVRIYRRTASRAAVEAAVPSLALASTATAHGEVQPAAIEHYRDELVPALTGATALTKDSGLVPTGFDDIRQPATVAAAVAPSVPEPRRALHHQQGPARAPRVPSRVGVSGRA